MPPLDKAARELKKEEQRREGIKNMAEYQAAMAAEQRKTARLRELRLAREEQEAAQARAAGENGKPAKKKRATRKKAARTH